MAPSYKQHTAVDDRAGVVVDAEVTTGEANEGKQLLEQVDRVSGRLGKRPECVTADAGYGHGRNWAGLEARNIDAVIVPQKVRARAMGAGRFKFDARNGVVKCPSGRVTESTGVRTIGIREGHEALTRARRRHARRAPEDRERYRRHQWMVEGRHGEAKTQHGLGRAARRGLDNVRIQAYLTAAVMNLKRLARYAGKAKTSILGRPGTFGRLRRLFDAVARLMRSLVPVVRPAGFFSRLRFA